MSFGAPSNLELLISPCDSSCRVFDSSESQVNMFSSHPKSPERGRSRFSKALPVAPGNEDRVEERSPPALTSKYMHSPRPPLPQEKMTIPRRPVGGQVEVTKPPSIKSILSNYSDSPGPSRSVSDSSTKESLSGVESETPQLPPKDSQRRPQTPPKSTNKLLDSPFADFTPSPPREEIWRRRSVKSERSLNFPNLKLQKSNGSTASPPRRQEPSTSERPLPRSTTSRKPIPARPAPPQPAADSMGNKLTKLKRGSGDKSSSSDESRNEPPKHAYSPLKRLPTPEYLKADLLPSTPQIHSPLSPFTPPEEKAPTLPQKSESRQDSRANVLRTNSESTTIRPDIISSTDSHSRTTSETLTVNSEPAVIYGPQPTKALPAATQTHLLTPQPSNGENTSPLYLPSPINALSAKFPTIRSPAAHGTIFPGPPLNVTHFECYQSHKKMRSTSNTLCPVACMICKRKDTEVRWRCTWCCLSACGSCMRVLSAIPGKDLKVCLDRLSR